LRSASLVLWALAMSAGVFAQAPARAAGEAVYQKRCAACHEQISPRIPHREALNKMPAARILRALDSGVMLAVAMTMHRDDRVAVAAYLGTDAPDAGPPPSAFCADRTVRVPARPSAAWNGWSADPANTRFQPAQAAGLGADRVPHLRLKWAFAFDGDVSAFAPPTVIDGQIFVGSAAGRVHALRAENGCLQWVFQANGPVRSAIVSVPVDGGHTLLFGDMTGWFYAVKAETGKLLWKVQVEAHDSTRLTGAPTTHEGVVYVPVASWEETRSNDPEYPCCTFRGSVVALRVRDGRQVWKTYMTAEPRETGRNPQGTTRLGPSGVGVWSAPTLDVKRRLLYVTTGNDYSSPATANSDAVVALRMADGVLTWSKQITPGDAYNSSCGGDRANCPGEVGPDFDFASSAILVSSASGRELLLAGQKSGIVYALDPEKKGAIVWQTRVGRGGTSGGVQWGMAADRDNVYAAVSDVGRTRPLANIFDTRRFMLDPKQGGGVTALRITDGSQVWHAAAEPCPDGAPTGCSPSQPGAVTAIPGVLFATSTDGHLRAHASGDGRIIWDFNTARTFEAVNGVPARGGSIEGPGAVVAGGMVFISSGYTRNGGMAGNVLLAFWVE
jgi:polyvinyl alcohol dehydrogenase (cytochrome)